MYSIGRLMMVAGSISLGALQASAQYSVIMPYEQVAVNNVNGSAVFSGADLSGMPGQPALPSYTVSFLLPPDADLGTVTASITNVNEKELSGNYTVDPRQPIRKEDGTVVWPKGRIIVDGKDTAIYRNDAFFPTNYQGTVSTEQPRQYKIAEIRIYPYLYNPVSKKLRMITAGTLSVQYSLGSTRSKVQRNDRIEKLLKIKVVNPSVFDSYGATPVQSANVNKLSTMESRLQVKMSKGAAVAAQASTASATSAVVSLNGTGYLIIANSYTQSHSQGLTNYVNYLTQQGAVVTLADESWYNPYGDASPQEITQGIRGSIYNWALSSSSPYYVLLIGNPDTAGYDLPMINCGGTPTDFGYADLSDNWQNEHIPWYCVGRIPVYYDNWINDATSDVNNGNLDRYLNRVINYENAPADAVEWRRTLLACSSPVGWSPESHSLGEYLKGILVPRGWNYCRMYDPYNSFRNAGQFCLISDIANMNPLPEHIYTGAANVVNTWNSETPGLVEWFTHGGKRNANGVLCTDSLQNLSDAYPAMVFSASCGTADPEVRDNLGVSLLWQNAICYIGASVEAYGPEIPAKSFGTFVSQNWDAGSALWAAKQNDDNTGRAQYFNLYGCPEVCLNIDQTAGPIAIPENFVAYPTTCGNSIQLTWNSVPGASLYSIERSEDFSSPAKRAGFNWIAAVSGSETSYHDNNINCCTPYKYRVYAIDANYNWSGYSAIDSAGAYFCSGDNMIPYPPSGLSVASSGSNSVTLTWTATRLATAYNIKRSTKSTDVPVTIATTTGTSFVDYNIVTGTTYYYYVSAVNSLGQGVNSASTSYTAAAKPQPPTLISVQNITGEPRKVCFQWTSQTPDKNDLNFEFRAARKFPDGTYSDSTISFSMIYGSDQNVARGNTWASSNINFETNTDFGFTARSISVCQNSDGSATKTTNSNYCPKYNFTTGQVAPVTSMPTNVTVTPGPEQLLVKWSFPGTTTDQAYEIYCTQPKVSWSTYPAATVSYPATSCTIYVPRGKTYKVSMRAVRSVNGYSLCSKFTNVISATVATTGLAAPTNLQVYPYNGNYQLKRGSILLTWSDNSTANTGYNIYRATSASGPFTTVLASTTNQYYYENTGLPDATKYYYQVKAYYGSELSAASNTASCTTLSNIAVNKAASATSSQSANPAKNGNDNSTTTRWCASSGSFPQSWTVDLGANKQGYALAGSEVMWEKSVVYKYVIETSYDNSNWTTQADLSNNTSTAQTQKQNFTYASGRYVRITVKSAASGSWASFYEFRVFGQ